jgi:hypothetical protein
MLSFGQHPNQTLRILSPVHFQNNAIRSMGVSICISLKTIAGHNWQWIDIDTINRSILLIMPTTDSIDLSVKDFFFLIDSINHQPQNPCQTDDHRSIGSHSTDRVDPSVRNWFPYPPFFLMKEKPAYILQ